MQKFHVHASESNMMVLLLCGLGRANSLQASCDQSSDKRKYLINAISKEGCLNWFR
jgi:hypothetical protein